MTGSGFEHEADRGRAASDDAASFRSLPKPPPPARIDYKSFAQASGTTSASSAAQAAAADDATMDFTLSSSDVDEIGSRYAVVASTPETDVDEYTLVSTRVLSSVSNILEALQKENSLEAWRLAASQFEMVETAVKALVG